MSRILSRAVLSLALGAWAVVAPARELIDLESSDCVRRLAGEELDLARAIETARENRLCQLVNDIDVYPSKEPGGSPLELFTVGIDSVIQVDLFRWYTEEPAMQRIRLDKARAAYGGRGGSAESIYYYREGMPAFVVLRRYRSAVKGYSLEHALYDQSSTTVSEAWYVFPEDGEPRVCRLLDGRRAAEDEYSEGKPAAVFADAVYYKTFTGKRGNPALVTCGPAWFQGY